MEPRQEGIDILNIFLTLDGEQNFNGMLNWSVFVRTAGCTVGCRWCDTKYSWPRGGKRLSVAEVFTHIREVGKCSKVTITGGEPLEQDWWEMAALIYMLASNCYNVSIETAGTQNVQRFKERINHIADEMVKRGEQRVDWKHFVGFVVDFKLSSAQASRMDTDFFDLGENDSIKYVIANDGDFLEAFRFAKRIREHDGPGSNVPQFFSPCHGKLPPHVLVMWMRDNDCDLLNIGLNLQSHKFIWPANSREEEDQGVGFSKRDVGRAEHLENVRSHRENNDAPGGSTPQA